MSTYKLTISQNGPPGMVLNFWKDGTNTTSLTSGTVIITNGNITFNSYSFNSSVVSNSQWPGYPTGGTIVENEDESETVTLTLSDGSTLVGDAVAGSGYFYTFDNLTVQAASDTYRFQFDFENMSFNSWLNGTQIDTNVSNIPSWPNYNTTTHVYTWSGNYGAMNIFGSSYLNSNMVGFTMTGQSSGPVVMTLADGTTLEGTGTAMDGTWFNFQDMVITSGGSGGSATQLDTPTASASCTASGVLTITGLNDANADGYKVKYWNNSQTESNATTATLTVSSGSATLSVTIGYSYTLKVQAVGDGTNYSDSEWSSAVGPTPVGVQLSYPSSLAFSSVTSSGFYASWATVTGATGYKLRYSEANMNNWTEVSTSTNNFYTLSGLIYGTTYDVQVKALGSGTSYTDSSWSGTSRQTTASAPKLTTPSGFTVSLVDDDIIVSGLNVANAVGYVIKFAHTNDPGYTETSTLTASNGSITYADFSQQYNGALAYSSLQVKAVADGVNYIDSDYGTGTELNRLTTPSSFTATYDSNNVHTISGLNVSNASGYKIWVIHVNSQDTISSVLTASNGTITFTDSLSFAGGEDSVKVQAVGNGTSYSDSEWSTAVSPTYIVPITPLSTPTVTATAASSSSITVGGLSGVSNASGYKIQYKVSTASQWTEVTPSSIVDGSYTLSGLASDTTYDIQGKAVGDGSTYSDSDWSATAQATTDYVPVTLSAPTITTTTNDRHSIVISGLNVANSTGYVISYSIHGDDNWITTNTVQAVSGSYTLSGLTVETAYDIKAKAIGNGGKYLDSPFSSVVTGETAAMAGSTGGIFRPIETTSTMLSDIEVESGQFIICTDTRKLYYDTSTNTRIELQ